MARGIFIRRTPSSRGKVKSAVDVFGDICQAFLLHLTKAAVSCLRSFSGHMITGTEKARRGAKVHSTNFRLFLIERSLFLQRKQAISVTCLLCAAQPHIVPYAQKSDRRPSMDDL